MIDAAIVFIIICNFIFLLYSCDSHGDYWNHLSADRKLEIDNLRSIAILRYMAKYTLVSSPRSSVLIECFLIFVALYLISDAHIVDIDRKEHDYNRNVSTCFH